MNTALLVIGGALALALGVLGIYLIEAPSRACMDGHDVSDRRIIGQLALGSLIFAAGVGVLILVALAATA